MVCHVSLSQVKKYYAKTTQKTMLGVLTYLEEAKW